MIMQVMYQNNKESRIDSNFLDQMIELNKIKMFMRSDGWVKVGMDRTRGTGGVYDGPERRGMAEWLEQLR